MWKPLFLTDDLQSRVCSLYKTSVTLNSGSLVDIDLTDTSAVGKTIGFSALVAGSLKLATVANTAVFNELGISMAAAINGGVPIIERLLGVATNYFSLPTGLNVPVYLPVAGDIIATTEYVGQLPGDTGATGLLDPSQAANFGASLGIYQGRFRLTQATDLARAQCLGMTAGPNGSTLAIVRFK